ncbi:MAG: hypothetical protein OXG85_05270 [Chloroflexi bacterium]|nr:hypothetical protein [Chloroflexota bacterium]
MPISINGFKTHRDHFAIDENRREVLSRALALQDTHVSDSQILEAFSLKETGSWNLRTARMQILADGNWSERITKVSYRPFDNRFCIFSQSVMDRPRRENFVHLINKENLSILIPRQQNQVGFRHVWVTAYPADSCVVSNKTREVNQVFPLYLYPSKQKELTDPDEFRLSHKGRRPNLSKAFVSEMEAKLGLRFVTEGSAFATPPPNVGATYHVARSASPGDGGRFDKSPLPAPTASAWFGPEDIFYYAYAIFHSPTYRERYAEFLKIDFPRLPLTSDVALFAALVKLGAELVGLHLMKSPKLSDFITTFDIDGDNEVARGYPKYDGVKQRVSINKTQYFGGVPPEVWDFHIGGYRVAEKWLKDRRGRKLAYEDLTHYQKIIVALSETMRIMSAIDAAIPGFPLE